MTFLCCLLIAGCARNDTLPSEVTQAFELAFTSDDLEATMALFSADAQMLPEYGPVVSGLEEIRQFMRDQIEPTISFNSETEMTLASGNLAIEQGKFTVRDVRRGSNVETGKYVHVWRKEAGDWKLFRAIWNTDVGPRGQVGVELVPATP